MNNEETIWFDTVHNKTSIALFNFRSSEADSSIEESCKGEAESSTEESCKGEDKIALSQFDASIFGQ
jgi:hypothetical protein